MSLFVIKLQYELNKEYITANFCVNKDKPKMGCNGQCHLKKELKKAAGESEDQKAPSPVVSLKLEYLANSFIKTEWPIQQVTESLFMPYLNGFKDMYYYSIDKPPC